MLSPFFEFVQFLCNSFEVMVANQQCRRKGIAREAVQLMQAGARIRWLPIRIIDKKEGTCPTYVQHMSNICPTLDIIKCQFDCTRTLCDDSDGSDLSFLVTYCHLLSLIVTYCHLTQKILRARPLPGNTLARSASWPRSRQNGLERNVGRENTARDDNVMFEKYAHDFGDRPWNNINIYKHLWIVYKRYYDIIIWYIHNI